MITANEAKKTTEEIIFKSQQILNFINSEIEKAIHRGSYHAHIELNMSEFEIINYNNTFLWY